jgi:hypothetical protein
MRYAHYSKPGTQEWDRVGVRGIEDPSVWDAAWILRQVGGV